MLMKVQDKPREFGVNSQTDCFLAFEGLNGILKTNVKALDFVAAIGRLTRFNSLSNQINFQSLDSHNQNIASLTIDFPGNKLYTSFQGKMNSVKLSNALAIIRDLAEIFSDIRAQDKVVSEDKITSSTEIEKLSNTEDEFSTALENVGNLKTDVKLKINGKERIALYPSIGRVVLTTSRGCSSIHLDTIKNCAHLFNRQFAKELCPSMGIRPNEFLVGMHKLYIGRCILGLARVIANGQLDSSHVRELDRIITLIKYPGFAFYSEPRA